MGVQTHGIQQRGYAEAPQESPKRVKSFNKAHVERQPLSEDMRATLREYYSSDVEKLSRLLGRDLTHWIKT
jgi:hypothetical protein